MVTGDNASSESLLEILLQGELEVTARLVDASNATLLATISHISTEVECIYKPVVGERPLWDFSEGSLANRERAAYVLSTSCGFDVVPVTVLRNGPFGDGAVQVWIDVDKSIDMINYFQQKNDELRNMALFDAVVNNTDRKIGHILPTIEGKVFGCDHGVTFHTENKLRTVLWQWAGEEITERERARLDSVLEFLSTPNELEDLLTEEELIALRARVEDLIESGSFPQPRADWPSIPWPPY